MFVGGSGHPADCGEMCEKSLHLRRAHLRGMTFGVKQDKAANPIQIGLLGADAVVLKTDFVPHLVEQAGLGLCSGGGGISHVST